MPRAVTSTYRLQLRREFPFAAVRALIDYFEKLGVSHLYLSPVLAARPGSTHGYDVVDHSRVNPDLGTEDELRALANDLHARGMGIVLDIVPNHMAASEHNPYWDDVLARGAASRYVDWFDIDWSAPHADGKVVLPVLGDELDDVLRRGELKLRIRDSSSRLAYFDRTFPLDPATLPQEIAHGRKHLEALLDAQHYRLTFWRRAHNEVNYRRFFDVNDLVALRMESDVTFDATHKLVLAWVRDGVIDGLRIDHIDGLRLPSSYLSKLRDVVDATKHRDAPERFPIVVEKILSCDELLPSAWQVEGTTGYDFMNEVEDVFLDADGYRSIEANYRGLRHNPSLQFSAVAREGKRHVLKGALRPDVERLARVAHAWRPRVSVADVMNAIVEVIVHLEVYRTYVSEPGLVSDADRGVLARAFRAAAREDGVTKPALALLEQAFFAPPSPSPGDTRRTELVMLFQQTSGPATAKGVEDTALYIYLPLASRNEVGGQPDRPLPEAHSRLHARNGARARMWPHTLLATNTHDTKRSADLRARLDVLTSVPDQWARYVSRWRKLNKARKRTVRGRPAPDTNSEHLFYQTLLGLWPAPRQGRRVDDLPDREWLARTRDRLVAYMMKAVRESKTRTSWTESDEQYEKALTAFVRETLEPGDDTPFLPDVARLTALTADDGFRFALARILLHFTAPGVPDIYQGDELWNVALVDPDNRRPVDFQRRTRLLSERESAAVLRDAFARESRTQWGDDALKLALTSRLLHFRRDHVRLLRDGEYVALLGADGHPTRLFAFARRSGDAAYISVARTRVPDPGRTEEAASLPAEFSGRWQSILTGRTIDLGRDGGGPHVLTRVDELIPANQPCELLWRTSR